jgi:hypothetical protein
MKTLETTTKIPKTINRYHTTQREADELKKSVTFIPVETYWDGETELGEVGAVKLGDEYVRIFV